MTHKQATDYVTGLGLDTDKWYGCQSCGGCSSKKIKCKKIGGYELQLLYPRGRYNLFKAGKPIKGGLISNVVNDLKEYDVTVAI